MEWGLSLDVVSAVESEGGGIYIGVALRAAADELAKSKIATRHLILFADANDSEQAADYRETLEQMRHDGITVSVIGMGTEHDKDAALLQEISKLGNGQIYFADRVSELPRLFAEDTIVLARAAFVDEPTGTVIAPDMALLGAPEGHGLPKLGGYNLTYLRPKASVALRTADDNAAPIVSFWQYGLGHSAAIAGEVDGEYSGGLTRWDGLRSLLGRLTRQLMPLPDSGEVLAKSQREGDDLHVTIEVDDTSAAAAANGTVTLVSGQQTGEPVTRPLRWEDRHRLGAHFHLGSSDSYFPLAQIGGKVIRVAPVALPYAPELEPRSPGEGRAILEDVAQLTAGVERASISGLFDDHSERAGRRPIASLLVWLALAMLVLEVGLRRLVPGETAWPRVKRSTLPAIPRPAVAPGKKAADSSSVEPPAQSPSPTSPPATVDPMRSALEQASQRARNRM